MYYQHSTYNHDYNKSPRGNPSHGDSSPRGGYNQDSHPRGEPRYFREAPKEFIDNRYGDAPPRHPVQPGEQFFVQEPRRSPHHSPISPRRQPPYSDRSDRRGYDGVSPPPMVGANSPRRYPHYDMTRQDLPPMNTYAINSTTQHDYGDFAQKQLMINDIRAQGDPVKQKLPMHDYHRFEQVHKGHQNPAGVFLLLRTDDQGFQDVKRQFERFTGDTPARKLLGIATSDMIDVKEGGAGWQRQSVLARWNGQYYNQERRGAVEKMLAVQWFPGEQKARDWINMDREFKHSAFPIPYGNQTSVLPLKYQPSSGKGYKTFMMMEFNNIADKHELRKYIDFMSKEMTRYNADIAFIDAAPVSVKSTIFDPRSHIVCHMFCDVREANRCFEELIEGRNFQHADVTTVVFSLLDIMRK